jgi:hypothetical protein
MLQFDSQAFVPGFRVGVNVRFIDTNRDANNGLLNVSGCLLLQVYSPGADDMMAQGPGETSQYPTKHALYSDIYYGGMT